jgi:hypothetical protein
LHFRQIAVMLGLFVNDIIRCYHNLNESEAKKIFESVLSMPTKANIVFADLEKLTISLGGEVVEGDGSRVKFALNGIQFFAHRPHPNSKKISDKRFPRVFRKSRY